MSEATDAKSPPAAGLGPIRHESIDVSMASTPTVLPARPRIRDGFEVFPGSAGTVYLVRASGGTDLAIPDAAPHVLPLIDALDGTRTVELLERELRERFEGLEPGEITDCVAQLDAAGVIEDAHAEERALAEHLTPEECERLDRQLAYFGDVGERELPKAIRQRRLKDARVALLGLGGLGSWTLYALACAGIGRVDGFDMDSVEASNLNRQILYTPADVGQPKATAAARAMRAFAPALDFRPHVLRLASQDDVATAVAGADFVVCAADWPPRTIERWVNRACFELGIPYTTVGQYPPQVRIGPTYVPGVTGCDRCAELAYRERYPLYDELADAYASRLDAARVPSFGPACGLIGAVAATDVVHHLSGIAEPATLGCALLIDVRTMEQTREPVERRADCEVCAG